MKRPWTIVYAHPQEQQLQCIEKSGPFDGVSALTYFREHLSKDSMIIAMLPGCHKPQVILPQYNKETTSGGFDAFQ